MNSSKEVRKTVKNSTEKVDYKTVHVPHMVDSTAFIVSLICQTATQKLGCKSISTSARRLSQNEHGRAAAALADYCCLE